jgi:hypothetical protein
MCAEDLGGVEPPSIHTTGLALARQRVRLFVGEASARERRAEISGSGRASRSWPGSVMIAIHWSRPSAVLPMETSRIRSDSASSFFHHR